MKIVTPCAGTKMILVVEDSPTQARHLQALLEQTGALVVCAVDGRMGLRLAQRMQPDIIVLDIQMPDISGFEVCQQLKNDDVTADIPVIMLTRQDGPDDVLAGLQLGAVDYIPKDAFADAVLLETLRQMGIVPSKGGDEEEHE